MDHFKTPLPYAVLAFSFIWDWVNKHFTETTMSIVLPNSVYQKLKSLRKDDKELDGMCRVNSTALVHATISVLLAFLCITSDYSIWTNPINGKSSVFDILTWLMSGYFIWDIVVCIQNLNQYGITFLLHAIISFIGIYAQAAATRARMPYYVALFVLTEMSTPFLHIRWFLTKAKETKTTYFKIMNWTFIVSFVAYRLVVIEIVSFVPVFKAIYFGIAKDQMSFARKIETSLVCVFWLILNYYWGILLLRSQLRHMRDANNVAIKKK